MAALAGECCPPLPLPGNISAPPVRLCGSAVALVTLCAAVSSDVCLVSRRADLETVTSRMSTSGSTLLHLAVAAGAVDLLEAFVCEVTDAAFLEGWARTQPKTRILGFGLESGPPHGPGLRNTDRARI